MAAHAILSASGAYRWTVCTPSARFEERFPDQSSVFALEGTVAHAVAEHCLRNGIDKSIDVISAKGAWDLVPELQELLTVFPNHTPEQMHEEHLGMARHVDSYTAYVMSRPGERFIEQRVDYSHLVPEGFGTSDAIVLQGDAVDIVDLKYGKGIKTYADGQQMKLYALGALHDYGFIFENVNKVRLHIVQPRLDHIDVHEMTLEDLVAFGEWIRPIAEEAFQGVGDYVAGDHCGFCRAKAVCKSRAAQNMALAMEEFKEPLAHPNTLTLTEVASLLRRLPDVIKWAKDVQGHALEQALEGEELPGYKLVEGRSTRKWVDETLVSEAMRAAGLDNDQIYNMKLVGITEAEKLLGKKSKVFDLAEKAPGSPTLVPLADKRRPMGVASAERDFKE